MLSYELVLIIGYGLVEIFGFIDLLMSFVVGVLLLLVFNMDVAVFWVYLIAIWFYRMSLYAGECLWVIL